MTVGAAAAARSVLQRQRWEYSNIYTAIMLDWDDVEAVATRALPGSLQPVDITELLNQYKISGATHLSLPELTINRLFEKGQLSVTQGSSTNRIYLQAKSAALADLVITELQARLPHIEAKLAANKLRIVGFYDDVIVHYVERATIAQFDPEFQSFINLNTPAEWQKYSQ